MPRRLPEQVVAPGVKMHLKLFWTLPPSSEGDQSPAMRERFSSSVTPPSAPRHDHRHRADMIGAVVALVGNVGFQADEVPGPASNRRCVSRL